MLKIGDTICIRLADRFYQQAVGSLQVQGKAKQEVTGPTRVGISTSLTKKELNDGQQVLLSVTGQIKTGH